MQYDTSNQKIIAREFLVLITTLIIGIIAFLSIYPYNIYHQNQVETINAQILIKKKISDSLSQSYNKKLDRQVWFSNKYINKFNLPGWSNNDKVWKRLSDLSEKDSIRFKCKSWDRELISFVQESGFETPEAFKNFIDANIIISDDIKRNNEASNMKAEIKSLNKEKEYAQSKIFSFEKQFQFALIAFIVSLSLLFIMRYIFYGIKWFIKTLNQKQSNKN